MTPFVQWVCAQFCVVVVTYFGVGGAFLLYGLLGKQKLQPEVQVTVERVSSTLLAVLINLCAVLLPSSFAVTWIVRALEGGKLAHLTYGLPSLILAPFELFALALAGDFLFYAAHRMLHTHALFRRVHARHHQHIAPFALAALDSHPLEAFIGNVLPLVAGVVMLRPHLFVVCTWYVLATVGTCVDHSGYAVTQSAVAHDLHHQRGNVNYSFLGIADRLFKTHALPRAEN